MKLADVLGRIPYLRVHRLEVSELSEAAEGAEGAGGGISVRMPLSFEISNHVGIVHAGALFTAAETAAGVAAWSVVPGDRAFVLLRGATVRYTRRAEGDVVAIARVTAEQAEAARAAFDAGARSSPRVAGGARTSPRGAGGARADLIAEVTAVDPAGETVFEGSFDYALRERKP